MSGHKAVKEIAPPKTTEAVAFSTFDESFTPDWDRRAGAQPAMDRNRARAAMGLKKTPLLGGVLKPSRK